MTTHTIVVLALIVFVAFSIESAIGFGSTVITVALAANVVPIDELLPALVPLNIVLSTFFTTVGRRSVDWRLLLLRILPPMVLGLPVGLYLLGSLDPAKLRVLFGAFVFALSISEIVASRARSREAPHGAPAPAPAHRTVVESALLLLAGVVHGAFATGGPLVVYVAGKRLGGQRAAFRATLSVLWLILNAVLVTTYVMQGKLVASTFRTSVALAPSLAVGIAIGSWAHPRIPERAFRVGIFVLLAVASVVLVARALAG